MFILLSTNDTDKTVHNCIEKIVNLRLFQSDSKPMDKSVVDYGYEYLVVSQFTLYADCKKGRRPDFSNSASPKFAKTIYDKFIEELNVTQSSNGYFW